MQQPFKQTSLGIAIILLLVTLFAGVGESIAQPIQILTFPYPPYMSIDGTGVAEKLVSAAFQEQGYSVKFLFYPRKRAINNFQQGQGQLFLGLRAYFPEQDIEAIELFYFRRVLLYVKSRHPKIQIKSLENLKGKTIGTSLGSSQVSVFRDAGLIVEEAPAGENNIKKLISGRVDFIYLIDLEAIHLIQKFFPRQHADFGFYEYQKEAADLIVRKNSPDESGFSDFRKGMKTLIDKGVYLHILEEFYGIGKVPNSTLLRQAGHVQ